MEENKAMTMVERLEAVLAAREEKFLQDPGYKDLRTFYEEMVRQGIAKRNTYELPQLDTVGRTLSRVPPSTL